MAYNFLSKKDVRTGELYLFKDGRIGLYLGIKNQKYTFLIVTCVPTIEEWAQDSVDILDRDIELQAVQQILAQKLNPNRPFNTRCIHSIVTFPKLMYSVGTCDIDLDNWFNTVYNKQQPSIVTDTTPTIDIQKVPTKELEIGRIYVTGKGSLGNRMEGWRSTYIYLGRKQGKGHAWGFVESLCSVKSYEEMYLGVCNYLGLDTNGNRVHSHGDISFLKSKEVYLPVSYAWINIYKFDKLVYKLMQSLGTE